MSFLNRWFKKKPQPIRTIPEFWNWFRNEQARLHQSLLRGTSVEAEVLDPVLEKLADLQEGIFGEAGMSDAQTAEFIFTASGNLRIFAFIEDLVAQAPPVSGWKFTALKQPQEAADLKIELSGVHFRDRDLFFYPILDAQRPDEIHIVVVHDAYTESNAAIITQGVYIFLDSFIGELDFAITIDNLTITGKEKAGGELIPIAKLREYLHWRQKEFVEKYEAVQRNKDEDRFSVAQAQSQQGNTVVLLANTALLGWDRKASHPWILKLQVNYEPLENGLPAEGVRVAMDMMHEQMIQLLPGEEGNLFVVRNTGEGRRVAYFACRDFRQPSRVLMQVEKEWGDRLRLDADIYQDKYWQTFKPYQFQ